MATAEQFFTHIQITKAQPELADFYRMQNDMRASALHVHHPFYSDGDVFHARRIVDLLPLIFAADMAPGERHAF